MGIFRERSLGRGRRYSKKCRTGFEAPAAAAGDSGPLGCRTRQGLRKKQEFLTQQQKAPAHSAQGQFTAAFRQTCGRHAHLSGHR